MQGCSLRAFPFSAPCNDKLVCATCWIYVHLYTLTYISMHESCLLVCPPYFNTMKLWTPDPNLHLSLTDTTFFLLSFLFALSFVCLLSSLFAFSLVCSHPCFYACHVYHSCLFYASSICFLHLFLSIACLLISCLCFFMYTHGTRMHGARARFPRCKKKGQGYKHVDLSQAIVVSRFRVQLFPLVMYSSKPLPSPPFLPQMVYIRYIMLCTIRPHLQSMATLVYFPAPIFWVMLQGCKHLLPALCARVVHDVCIYIPACPLPMRLPHSVSPRQAMPNFHRESKVTCHQIFAVEIWHFAQMPQESIDWDHTNSKAKPQSPHVCKALKANIEIMFLLPIS